MFSQNKLLLSVLIFCYSTCSGKTPALQKFGDIAQVANPLIGSLIAHQNGSLEHYVFVQSQSLTLMGLGKILGQQSRWEIGHRPDDTGYNGMPSGHTTAAWSAASYVRSNFSTSNDQAAPLLYISAALTGISRVESRRHTIIQVLAAIALSETVNYLNMPSRKTSRHSSHFYSMQFYNQTLSVQARFY